MQNDLVPVFHNRFHPRTCLVSLYKMLAAYHAKKLAKLTKAMAKEPRDTAPKDTRVGKSFDSTLVTGSRAVAVT